MKPESNSREDNRRGFIRRILTWTGIGSVAAVNGRLAAAPANEIDADPPSHNQSEPCEQTITTYTYNCNNRLVGVARGGSA